MLINDPTIARRLREGTIPVEELQYWLINNLPVPQLAHELAECLIEQQVSKPILITQDEFMAHFRVKGTKWVDGQMVPEGRGANRWSKKEGGD